MIKPIVFGVIGLLVVAVAVVLVVAAAKPDTFRVQRSMKINAPADKVFAWINDFRRWESWSPYEKLDPAMKRSYSGAASGPGAVYGWDGNGNVGAGRIEIDETSPPSRVALTLVMTRPFACRNAVEFTLKEEAGATTVTWAMEGPSHFFSKVVSVFIDTDRMVGGQFEEGLASLKGVAEKESERSGPDSASHVATGAGTSGG